MNVINSYRIKEDLCEDKWLQNTGPVQYSKQLLFLCVTATLDHTAKARHVFRVTFDYEEQQYNASATAVFNQMFSNYYSIRKKNKWKNLRKTASPRQLQQQLSSSPACSAVNDLLIRALTSRHASQHRSTLNSRLSARGAVHTNSVSCHLASQLGMQMPHSAWAARPAGTSAARTLGLRQPRAVQLCFKSKCPFMRKSKEGRLWG